MSNLGVLKQFDNRQFFRFFVDGRFHKKYNGWKGYEKNEPGSVKGMLNAYVLMLENYDLSSGVNSKYIVDLHKASMFNVETKNPKSTPGDLRYLEAGFHFFAGQTTINSLSEVFRMRQGDGTNLFHAKGYEKTADELDIIEVYRAIQKKKKLRYRPWYPVLDKEKQDALNKKGTLEDFYEVKHFIQMQFAARMEQVVDTFNHQFSKAGNDYEKLYCIGKITRDLELLHPFPDGNCRVFVNILMNHLLMFYGFLPVILKDPNLDAEFSYDEFVLEITEGMENTRILLEDPAATLFNYSIGEASNKECEEFLAQAKNFYAKLDKITETPINKKSSDIKDKGKGIYLNSRNLVGITDGRWINLEEDMYFEGVGSHNTFKKDFLYFGLSLPDWKKDKKNITKEIDKVFKRGARAIVLDDEELVQSIKYPVLLVDDIERSFKDAAVTTRREVGCKAVLLTGTVGKTGCKIQLHHCLKGQAQVHATLNSANTKIPVLWSLANLKASDEVEINEVSVGGGPTIGSTRSEMVSPDICMFTSIGPNHMNIHKSIDNLINAKSSVVDGLRQGGISIVNSSDDLSPQLITAISKRTEAPMFTFGIAKDDTARLIDATFDNTQFGWKVEANIDGEMLEYFLPLYHQHAPLISTGVLLTIKKLGYNIHQAARDYEGIDPFETMGKLYTIFTEDGSILFYDQSRRGGIQGMRSAFQDIRNFDPDGKVVALLGGTSVEEDNEWTAKHNTELGELVNQSKISRLYTTGKYMHHLHNALKDKSLLVKHSDDLDELAVDLMGEVEPGDLLFIMGSAYLYLGRLAKKILDKHSHERIR